MSVPGKRGFQRRRIIARRHDGAGQRFDCTASGLVIAADVADMAYFGLKGVDNYIKAEDYYNFARGVSSLLGDAILRAAEADRESGMMTAVGLIAPGAGALISNVAPRSSMVK